MRLTDADALLVPLWAKRPLDDDNRPGMAEMRTFCDGVEEYIDAAPTVRCEECEWSAPYGGSRYRCDHSPHVEVGFVCVGDGSWGCAYFERRTP